MSALIRHGNFIDGAWSSGGATYPVLNPANGELIAEVQKAGAEETNQAIAAAERALPAWRKLTAKERSQRIKRWGELMLSNQKELATLLSREQGKPLAEAMGEVVYAASFLEWFAEEAKRAYGDVIPSHKADARIIVVKEAIGVVAAITPWNFPLAMVTRKVGPALAAGCTMILKPSEETPLSAFALAVLAEQAGIPAGVFNVVSGDAVAIGGALQASSVVRKLSFTGSTRTGKLLMRQAADTLKKVSLELGGNAPFIVFDDADLDAAVKGAMASKFRNTGQTCVCVNRFFIQDGVYEAFTGKLAEAVAAMRVGSALEGETEQGPLINAAALAKVELHVSDAVEKGAKVLCGGRRHALGGTFYEPTILAEANGEMLIAQDETFGPVAACFRFKDEAEVLQKANDTPFGLSAYFYSRDIGRVWRMAEGLEAGMVGINEGIISTEVAPFGGIKESGLGREGSKYGLDDYLEIKYLLMGGL
ncbi:NAD-dependent succinate-semialdehyde dehydrogenase [Pseudomonas vancouverensis]|uniref:NAD-dependent succinate-semialdehyde dehydrogenase n=1 Tax=Pseudomonas vancouverensis TaxID=95300 RepID=A0A1H2MZ70_PSEVA|nr:NAD-dependent succinate-semialdehyde dehydrogenase [Pseudomonas vancouverensis]KAB0495652.1 NAD-dependent succinate-semialdehyde dehydrogenase [Pseudomonas vancouverensis]TDB65455.1 NAD-dependent succinate-semialdehyde dehydrogenase [Pseudomonas vancouverensis]SDU98392.1 succinate-semialdehyde dehydrogenase / glutarate-semialdehyde dehydrogenase [Pseudomonas vancouverensis]